MLYSSISSARRAAKKACQKVYGPAYQAFEGVDFVILPTTRRDEHGFRRNRWTVQLMGA